MAIYGRLKEYLTSSLYTFFNLHTSVSSQHLSSVNLTADAYHLDTTLTPKINVRMSNLSSNTMLLKLSPITRHTAFSAFLMPTVLKPRPQHKLDITAQARRGLSELLSMNNDKDKQSIHGRQPLKPGEVSPRRDVPPHIPRPPYADSGKMPDWDMNPQTHNAEGLSKMREACTLAARVLKYAGTLVKPGITTDEIDRAVHEMIIDAGAYPSPLNYGNFPKSVCTSVNECICHGIPDSRQLQEGDIVNIDVTVYLNVCCC